MSKGLKHRSLRLETPEGGDVKMDRRAPRVDKVAYHKVCGACCGIYMERLPTCRLISTFLVSYQRGDPDNLLFTLALNR
jgi:hypothetical protein